MKIGMTANLWRRMEGLGVNSPKPLRSLEFCTNARLDADLIESCAHNKALARRIYGEWFGLSAHEASAIVREAVLDVEAGRFTKVKRLPDGRHESGIAWSRGDVTRYLKGHPKNPANVTQRLDQDAKP